MHCMQWHGREGLKSRQQVTPSHARYVPDMRRSPA
ncbi:hypothetical protein SAMN05216466_104385 [Paraburkholderia phenazinium]|jgi:hypothetical protein|uniref:Uncharacterized protein n=1 Tax=Paraburkholderia phenazinium TaxID=60549 RepID=A0A1G7W3P1_9BURK|nr:hypothetical protein SAMN05216466_104385 [Paraburkholderia phenazinium]